MLSIRQRINIKELADCFTHSTDIFRPLGFWHQLLPFDSKHIDGTDDAHRQESQLIGRVGGVLIQCFQHDAVGKSSEGIQQAVDYRNSDGQPAFRIVIIRRILTGTAQLLIFIRFGKAQGHNAEADQGHRNQRYRRQIIADAFGDENQNCHNRSRTVADRRRNRELDIPQAEIANGHGEYIQSGYRQIGKDNLPGDLNTAEKDAVSGMKAHNKADRHHHFQMAVFIPLIPAADFGEKV